MRGHLNAFDLFDRITPTEAEMMQTGYRNIELALKTFVNAGGKVLAGCGNIGHVMHIHEEQDLSTHGSIAFA